MLETLTASGPAMPGISAALSCNGRRPRREPEKRCGANALASCRAGLPPAPALAQESCDAKPTTAHMTTHQRNNTRPFASRANRLASSSARQRPGQGVNAKARYVRYVAMARAAAQAGDVVEAENCYQHAEHYFRLMRERPGMEEPPE